MNQELDDFFGVRFAAGGSARSSGAPLGPQSAAVGGSSGARAVARQPVHAHARSVPGVFSHPQHYADGAGGSGSSYDPRPAAAAGGWGRLAAEAPSAQQHTGGGAPLHTTQQHASSGAPLHEALSALSQQLAELRGQVAALAAQSSGSGGAAGGAWQAPDSSGSVPHASSGGGSRGSSASGAGGGLTHVDSRGRAAMVDVSPKQPSAREARASCRVLLGREAFELVQSNSLAKGDVLTVAQLAGVIGAKATAALIPLCHTLLLSKVDVQLSLDARSHAVAIASMARTVGNTGVEMEALTAAAVAALTVYDMCKAVTKDATITDLRLEFKSGGKSGTWQRGG